MISAYSVILVWEYVLRGQIWRIITTFFYAGPFSMNFLFTMMMNYWTIKNIETHFERKEAEMATLMLFNAALCMFYGWVANDYMTL